MKNLSTELKHGLLAPLFFLLFTMLMYIVSPATEAAKADVIDDTKSYFPDCTISK